MDVRNCKRCNKLFNYTGDSKMCPACNKEMDEKFFEVRDYIYKNPTASMPAVAEDCDVPLQQIKRWVKEERLSFSKESGVTMQCENCGKSILTGRYCKECKNTMTDKFTSFYQEKKPEHKAGPQSSNGKMRFLGN